MLTSGLHTSGVNIARKKIEMTYRGQDDLTKTKAQRMERNNENSSYQLGGFKFGGAKNKTGKLGRTAGKGGKT